MSHIMHEDEAREAFGDLLDRFEAQGPILVERDGNKPAILILALGQPGRAAAAGRLQEVLEPLQGQPGNAAPTGQPGGGGSDRETIAEQLQELVEALQGQPGRA
ncbi:MAG TPA: hypothetical protein VK879_10565 [Candidatus Sulfomarinibacteraceae bacterium]|nr:hypothetical protein [Candidatus Sulfomarinibacteraceae bacterium]